MAEFSGSSEIHFDHFLCSFFKSSQRERERISYYCAAFFTALQCQIG